MGTIVAWAIHCIAIEMKICLIAKDNILKFFLRIMEYRCKVQVQQ